MKDKPFVYHPSFRRANASESLFEISVRTHDASWFTAFVMENRDDIPKPPYQEPWTKDEERTIFLQFNYARYRVSQGDDTWAATARRLHEQIASANLGLICMTISKYPPPVDEDRNAYISEAQAALCRSILGFDVRKDHKFSTYACAAMFRAVARLYRKYSRDAGRMIKTASPDLLDRPVRDDDSEERLEFLRHILATTDLTDKERQIIQLRFFSDPPLTLEKIGERMGCTKEWVRQMEARLLTKLRDSYQNG